ncbi:MAG: beta strand repeat-containing protein [Planctomycetaceae bacterium]
MATIVRWGRLTWRPIAAWRRHVALAALVMVSCSDLRADTLVSWDIPTGGATTAPVFGSAASGLTVSAIGKGTLSNASTSSTGWRLVNLLNSSTVNPAAMTTQAFDFTFTTSPRTTASITQLFQSGTIGQVSPEGTGPPTSVELWAQTVGSGGTSAWSQVGSAFSTPTVGGLFSLNTAFVSGSAPYNVAAGTTVNFKIVPLGATGGASSPKFKWISTSVSAADLSLIGTTGGGAWNMYWNGGASGTWNTTSTDWLKDNTGSAEAFVAGDNAYFSSAADVVVDAGGISAGSLNVTNASGTVSLGGGSLAAASLVKSGAGVLVLSASNAFVSGGSITGGTVVAAHASALGSASVTFDNATLAVTTGSVTSPLGVGSGGMTVEAAANATLTGAITGGSSARFTKTSSGTLTLSGAFGTQNTAPLELDVVGGGLVLSGAQKNVGGAGVESAWEGPVSLNGAVLMLHGGTVTGAGVISVDGANSVIAARLDRGTSVVTNDIVLTQSLTGSSPNGSNRLVLAGDLSGPGGLTMAGNGTKTLEGTNTYAGPTTISAGSLRVNGSITNDSTVTVAAGATLGGNGTVNSVSSLPGAATLSLQDGLGASALTFGKGLTVDAASTTQWYLLANTDAAGDAGATLGYSQTRVNGGNLTIASGATITLNFQYSVGNSQSSTVLWSDPFWTSSHSWKIADFSGAGTSTVANYTINNASFLDSGTNALNLTTQGSFSITNDGEDVFLVFTAVPEPSTSVALLSAGLVAAAMLRRRR